MFAAYPLVRNLSAFATRSGVRARPSRSGSSPSSMSSRLIRSFTFVFYIALFALPALARAQDDPDALYRERLDPAKAQQAADIWNARMTANPRDFESAWKLSK